MKLKADWLRPLVLLLAAQLVLSPAAWGAFATEVWTCDPNSSGFNDSVTYTWTGTEANDGTVSSLWQDNNAATGDDTLDCTDSYRIAGFPRWDFTHVSGEVPEANDTFVEGSCTRTVESYDSSTGIIEYSLDPTDADCLLSSATITSVPQTIDYSDGTGTLDTRLHSDLECKVTITDGICDPATDGSFLSTGGFVEIRDGAELHLNDSQAQIIPVDGMFNWRFFSDGTWQGIDLGVVTAPEQTLITHANDSITLDFSESALNITFCDAAGASCTDANEIHAEDEWAPGTMAYIEWPTTIDLTSEDDSQATHAAGMFFEVIAANDSAKTVELELPRLGPTYGCRHFGSDGSDANCADTGLDGNDSRTEEGIFNDSGGGAFASGDTSGFPLHNIMSADGRFTLDSSTPIIADNDSNNSIRWLIQIDSADDPFDANGEFEGFQLCNSDLSWCATITQSLADNGSGGEDQFVIWADPYKGGLAAGDEMAVCYACIRTGDPIRFVNMNKLAGTGHPVIRQHFGTHWGRTSDKGTPVKWLRLDRFGPSEDTDDTPVAMNCSSGAQTGFIPACTALQLDDGNASFEGLLIERFGGDGDAGADLSVPATAITQTWSDSATFALDTKHEDSRFSKVQIRFSDAAINLDATASSASRAYRLTTANAASVGDGSGADVAENLSLRHIRTDGIVEAVDLSSTGRVNSCPDSLLLQNGLFLHGRPGMDAADNNQSLSTLELDGGWGTSCNFDNFVSQNPVNGQALVVACDNCIGAFDISSFVLFGSYGDRAPDETVSEVATLSVGSSSSGFARLSNFALHGTLLNISNIEKASYFVVMDHGSHNNALADSFNARACNQTIGYYQIGGRFGPEMTDGCASDTEFLILDWYHGMRNINGSLNGAISWGDLTTASPKKVVVDGVFMQVPSDGLFFEFESTTNDSAIIDIDVDNSTFIHTGSPGSTDGWIGVVGNDSGNHGGLRTFNPGPNIYTNLRCENTDATPTVISDEAACTVAAANTDRTTPSDYGHHSSTSTFFYDGVTDTSSGYLGRFWNVLRWSGTDLGACPSGGCVEQDAMPRWAGVAARTMAHDWVSLDPAFGYYRTEPRFQYLPKVVRDHFNNGLGGGGLGGGPRSH